ncbi:unnamed protein product [Musa textilis]
MDTRPYRLSWPCSCIIFDISPQSVFNVASKKLKGTGAKIGRNCNLVHVPLESIDLQAALYKKGFSGNMPSLWAIQVRFGFALYFLKFLYPIPFSILHLVSPTWRRVEGTRIEVLADQ